jgi:hypothetical protein
MKRWNVVLPVVALLSGCAGLTERVPETGDGPAGEQIRPQSRPAGVAPPASARTEEEFDTTTAEERMAAQVMPAPGGERSLGRTVASLGSPSEPGFWLRTPLVRQERPGRVVYPQTGRSVKVTLIPIDGPPTGGSRMSLSALRLIGAPLAGLPEVDVFADS